MRIVHMGKNIIIDNQAVSNIVFYPRRTPIPTNLAPNIHTLQFEITKRTTIGGIFFQNDEDLPTILLFHGNGELALEYIHSARLFFECGVNLAVMDFRGYGFSTGDPYYTSLISDAMPIYFELKKWMDSRGFNETIFVLGRSLGSVCASEIGANNPNELKGIIFESGFASVYNIMTQLFRVKSSQMTPSSLDKYSNDFRARKLKKPVLIIHGSSDMIIPHSEANLLYKNIPENVEKKLVIIEGAGHNDIINYRVEYFSALEEFITKNK